MARRAWREVMGACSERGRESSRQRCRRAFAGRDFDPIRDMALIDTRAEALLRVLATDKPSANHYLRRLVRHAEGLGWLPWTIMAVKVWPRIKKGDSRAITAEEHQRIIDAESNVERRRYLSDDLVYRRLAGRHRRPTREHVVRKLLTYHRAKRPVDAALCKLRIGQKMQTLLDRLPTSGLLFPTIAKDESKDRAAEFSRRCRLLAIKGVSLKSYRTKWAERAAEAGFPLRYAQEALGHKSASVHQAYARRAVAEVPALEDCETRVAG